ncbi:MAG TPA: WD40 repeat domain-containing protein, partial [Acidimicrobiales bacterium]|nr:WD40 repeat domain-containing protein [Acidimicrobiales bacterium]
LVDPSTGKLTRTVDTPRPAAWDGLSFDHSGHVVAVGYDTGADAPAVEQFDVSSGTSLGTLPGPPGSYEVVSYSSDGRWLAAVRDTGEGYTVMAWDLVDHAGPFAVGTGIDFRFLPGSDRLVLVDPDQPTLNVVALEPNGQTDDVRQMTRPAAPYTAMEVDPTGHVLAISSLPGRRVDLLDLTTGDPIAKLDMPSPGNIAFSADGKLVAVDGGDNLIRVYTAPSYTQPLVLAGSPDQPIGLAFSHDASQLISAAPGQLRSWDLSPQGPRALGNFRATGGFVGLFGVAADQAHALVTVYKDGIGAVERVDQPTGTVTQVWGDLDQQTPSDTAMSADMTEVAGLDQQRVDHGLDVDTGQTVALAPCEQVIRLDRSGTTALVDGQSACEAELSPGTAPVSGQPTSSRVVDMSTGRTILDLGKTLLWGGEFGPPRADGRPGIVVIMDASASKNRLDVRDLTTGADLGSYAPDKGFLLKAALTPDAKRLIVTTTTGDLTVLDLAKLASPDGAVVWTVKAHNGSVQGLAVSSSGLIATAASSGNVRVWSPSGHMLADLPIHPDDVPSVTFASGTTTLYYEDGNDVLRKFSVDPSASMRFARTLVTRPFTPDECARYFPDQHCPTFAG